MDKETMTAVILFAHNPRTKMIANALQSPEWTQKRMARKHQLPRAQHSKPTVCMFWLLRMWLQIANCCIAWLSVTDKPASMPKMANCAGWALWFAWKCGQMHWKMNVHNTIARRRQTRMITMVQQFTEWTFILVGCHCKFIFCTTRCHFQSQLCCVATNCFHPFVSFIHASQQKRWCPSQRCCSHSIEKKVDAPLKHNELVDNGEEV